MRVAYTGTSLAVVLFVASCQPTIQETSGPALDPNAYVTNWTHIFKSAIKRSKDNQVSVASGLGDLGYVPGLANDCAEQDLGPVGLQAFNLFQDLHRNAQSKGRRNNIILQGDPGIDLDARVQVLAYYIAQGDCSRLEPFNGLEVVSVDLKRLSQDAAAKKLSFAAFMKVLNGVLETYKNRAIFYLNEASDAAFLGGSADEALKVFIDNDANTIVKSTLPNGPDFTSAAYNERVFRQRLDPMPSQVVVSALEGMVNFPAKVREDIVRMSRAFFSAKGVLTPALQMLRSVSAFAEASANKIVDAAMIAHAVLDLNEKWRVHETLSAQTVRETKAWTDPLAVIDQNVARSAKFYADEHTRVVIEQAIEKSISGKLSDIEKTLGNVKEALQKIGGANAKSIAAAIENLDQAVQDIKGKIKASFQKGAGISIYAEALEKILIGLDATLKTITELSKRDLALAKDIITMENELLLRLGTLEQGMKADLDNIGVIMNELGKIPKLVLAMHTQTKEIIAKHAVLSPEQKRDLESLANGIVATISAQTSHFYENAKLSDVQKKALALAAEGIATATFNEVEGLLAAAKLNDVQKDDLKNQALQIASATFTTLGNIIEKARLGANETKMLADSATAIAASTSNLVAGILEKAALSPEQNTALGKVATDIASQTVSTVGDLLKGAALSAPQKHALSVSVQDSASQTLASISQLIAQAKLSKEQLDLLEKSAVEIATGTLQHVTEIVARTKLKQEQIDALMASAAAISNASAKTAADILKTAALSKSQQEALALAAQAIANATYNAVADIVEKAQLSSEQFKMLTESATAISLSTSKKIVAILETTGLSADQNTSLTKIATDIAEQTTRTVGNILRTTGLSNEQQKALTTSAEEISSRTQETASRLIAQTKLSAEQLKILEGAALAIATETSARVAEIVAHAKLSQPQVEALTSAASAISEASASTAGDILKTAGLDDAKQRTLISSAQRISQETFENVQEIIRKANLDKAQGDLVTQEVNKVLERTTREVEKILGSVKLSDYQVALVGDRADRLAAKALHEISNDISSIKGAIDADKLNTIANRLMELVDGLSKVAGQVEIIAEDYIPAKSLSKMNLIEADLKSYAENGGEGWYFLFQGTKFSYPLVVIEQSWYLATYYYFVPLSLVARDAKKDASQIHIGLTYAAPNSSGISQDVKVAAIITEPKPNLKPTQEDCAVLYAPVSGIRSLVRCAKDLEGVTRGGVSNPAHVKCMQIYRPLIMNLPQYKEIKPAPNWSQNFGFSYEDSGQQYFCGLTR